MLKKLLKYDLKYVFKVLIIFYTLSIFFAVLTRYFFSIDNCFLFNVIAQVCSGITISMIFNILINNIMRLWVRFQNNFYKDEGYLTHTLPVKRTILFLSKNLTSVISLLVSFIIIALSLCIAYYSKDNLTLLKTILLPIANLYNTNVISILSAFLFILFLEVANAIQAGYIGIVLGHKMNDIKTGFSVIYGFVTYVLSQIIAIAMVFIVALFNKNLMNLFYTTEAIDLDMVKLIIYLAIGIYSILVIVGYLVNLRLFKAGINID